MGVSSNTRIAALERDGYACVKCGSKERLTMDHIRPKSKGGSNELKNLRTLCEDCNNERGDEWDGKSGIAKPPKPMDTQRLSKHSDRSKSIGRTVISHEPGCDPMFGCVSHCKANKLGFPIRDEMGK